MSYISHIYSQICHNDRTTNAINAKQNTQKRHLAHHLYIIRRTKFRNMKIWKKKSSINIINHE